MAEGKKRKKFFNANKYQRKILSLTFLPSFFICLFLTIVLSIFFKDLNGVVVNKSAAVTSRFISHWSNFVVLMIWIFFGFILVWAYSLSANLVGAFERVVRELDGIIAGKGKKHIRARIKDELANELLKRINILIDGFQGKK